MCYNIIEGGDDIVREIGRHNKFIKDFDKFKKKLSFDDLKIFFNIIDKLAADTELDTKYKDHNLKGNYKDCRECHVKPDLLLIYQKEYNKLILIRLNTHSELFK